MATIEQQIDAHIWKQLDYYWDRDEIDEEDEEEYLDQLEVKADAQYEQNKLDAIYGR